jgi:hypothetical protein
VRRRPARRGTALTIGVLLLGAVALLAVAVLRAAPGMVRFDHVAPVFGGSAPVVTLPDYGISGTYVVGYEHGATARMTLPVHNSGPLPVTVTSLDLGGGVAPLLAVQDVVGLPLSLGAGETGTVEVTAELANCRYFHEREVQYYEDLTLGFSVLGQESTRTVAYDRPVMVHSPMIVGCPDRKLNRQADDRTDLTGAA